MSELDETQAIGQVITRLAERFPDLERSYITEVVDDEHHKLEKSRVRDFVPVLVEKAAKKRLKKEAKSSSDDADAPASKPAGDSAA